jgi:hypothetical protein
VGFSYEVADPATELDSDIPQLFIHNLDLCLRAACENLNHSSASICRSFRRANILGPAELCAVGHTGFRFRKQHQCFSFCNKSKVYGARFEVRTVVLVKIEVFRYVTLRRVAWRILKDVSKDRPCLGLLTLKMNAVRLIETSVTICQLT